MVRSVWQEEGENKMDDYYNDDDDEYEYAYLPAENRNTTNVTTTLSTRDIYKYCKNAIAEQIERSKEHSAPMNEPIEGDTAIRRVLLTLLSNDMIRDIFIEVTSTPYNMTRVKPLFGSPPYNFLRPGDAYQIRTKGLCASRANMTYEKRHGATIETYSQFGIGHMVDQYSRTYKVMHGSEDSTSYDTPVFTSEFISRKKHLFLNVRIKKMSNRDKNVRLLDSTLRNSVLFPSVGEKLQLRYTKGMKYVLQKLLNVSMNFSLTVTVQRVVPRSAGSSTAGVIALII